MRIKINEQRFKQIVREELAIAKLGSRLHEEQAQPPVQTQQVQSDMARRKKQYTCRCSAKFMDYENVKGAPLCPKCNDAEVKATGQSQQQPTHEASRRGPSSKKRYECPQCHKKFMDYANLDTSAGKPLCPKCDDKLIFKQNSRREE